MFTQLAPTGDDGGLVIPAGRTIQLYLYSPDVIHAFYVPQFLFKRDVVPGRRTPSSSRSTPRTPGARSAGNAPSCVAQAIV